MPIGAARSKWNYRGLTLLLLVLVSVRCETSPHSVPRYAWETAQEPEYKERFRGRWWNYYDRGMWYQLRGRYEESESDLKHAKNLRAKDQLWPRTYGLHFLREYFPSRELGITYYQKGEFEESVRLLELSLREQYSARASYYADLARVQTLSKNGLDKAPPTIQVLSPTPDRPTDAIYATLVGEARDDQFVKEVYVNGEPIDIRQSLPVIRFEHPITLSPGDNRVHLKVVDLLGKSVERDVNLIGDHEGPIISFDPFDSASSTLSGVVFDSSGVEYLKLYGMKVELDDGPNGVRAFRTRIDSATRGMQVPYVCADTSGNLTQGTAQIDFKSGRVAMSLPPNIQYAMAGTVPIRTELAAVPVNNGIRAAIVNLADQQRVFQNEITVNIEIDSSTGISQVMFDGRPVQTIPARKSYLASEALLLGNEPGRRILRVEAIDTAGQKAWDEKIILRELSTVETAQGKLNFTLIDFTRHHAELTDNDVVSLFSDIKKVDLFKERFGRLNPPRDDKAYDGLIKEQTVQKLVSEINRLKTEKIEVGDVLLHADINGGENFIEIILDCTSTATGNRIAERVDIADTFSRDKDQFAVYRRKLVAALAQQFPRIQRGALAVSVPNVKVDLTTSDGVGVDYPCVLVRREVVPGQKKPWFPNCYQGQLTVVGNDKEDGIARFRLDETFKLEGSISDYFVITK